MRNLSLIIFLILCHFISTAQFKKPGFTVGASGFYANPQAAFKSAYKGGAGGEIKAGVGLKQTFLVASVGYAAFASESGNSAGALICRPKKIGIKQYFLAKRLFVNGDIGVVSLKDKSMSESEQRFTRDIGVGARLLGLEAGIFYDTWDNLRGPEGSTKAILFKLGFNLTL